MARRIAIIQGHPDPAGNRLMHAMADAYAAAAAAAWHEVRRIETAKLNFPWLRTQAERESGSLPGVLQQARRLDTMRSHGANGT